MCNVKLLCVQVKTCLQTMETSFPRGTVRYMEVGLSSGAQANSARLSEGTRMPSRRRGPWHTGSTGRGTLLWDSHRRRLRRRQSQAHLKHLIENLLLFVHGNSS